MQVDPQHVRDCREVGALTLLWHGQGFEKASQTAFFEEASRKNLLYLKKHNYGKELAKFLVTEKDRTGELIKMPGLSK